MIGETVCTVYRANNKEYDRIILQSCHWQENKASNVIKSGLQNAHSITVYVFSPTEDMLEIKPQDLIVKGECNFIFDNTSEQSLSKSLKELKQSYSVHSIKSVDCKMYGSKSMQHIKITAG